MKAKYTQKIAVTAAACALVMGIAGCKPGSSASNSNTAETTTNSQSADAGATTEATADTTQTTEAPADQKLQMLQGTVHVCSAEELIELQGADISAEEAGNGGTYAVLVFDSPTDVTGMSADGSGEQTQTANMLGIAEHTEYDDFTVEYGDLEACRARDGQHIMISVSANDITFPSDVRLPMGEPAASQYVVIG